MSQEGYELFVNLCGIYHILLQIILFLIIWDIFYKSEREKKTLLLMGIFAAVNIFLYISPGVPGGLRYAVSAVMVLGYCHVKYRGRLEKAVFTLLLFYNFHGMSFLIASSIYQFVMDGMIAGLDIWDAEYMYRLYRCQVVGMGLNVSLYTAAILLMTGIIKQIVKLPLSMNRQEAVFLSVLNVVGGMLTWMVIDISAVQIDREIFFLFVQKKEMVWKIPMIAILLCAGEISAICIFQKYKELQEEREKHFVEEQQLKAMKRRLEEAENFYGSIRRVRHEMKSHMANIKGLVAGEKYGEVEKYIGKLDETIQELTYKFSTGNAVTDVIINDKYRLAKDAGITFSVKFEYRKTDTISAFDMGVVLHNLLDNALEACEKLDRERRYISLNLKRKEHFLLIEVENSFDGMLIWEDEEKIPATTKQSGLPDILMEHGVGLKNVKDVAERYLGYMDIRAEKDTFRVIVMLQQKEEV